MKQIQLQKARMRIAINSHLNSHLLFPILLVILFCWFYGQFVHRLYFAMDDYIESNTNLVKPALAVVSDCLTGRLNYSGYRPATCASRAIASHLFSTDYIFMYHAINLVCHLLNTLLVFRLTHLFLKRVEWSFLAAAIFLLLPSHNEAVFWYSGNSNLLALLFALISLLAILSAGQKIHWGWWCVAWFTYIVSVAFYEVMLPLPLLFWLADWIVNKRPLQRYQLLLYGIFFLISCGLLWLRLDLMGGQLNATADAYAISISLDQIIRNYIILFGQIILLHTSPWIHLPLYLNIREWLSPWSGTALFSIFVVTACTLTWFVYTWHRHTTVTYRSLFLWFGWGVFWLCLMSLPFTLLSERNPENRYVYIPSFGFSLALSALFAFLYQRVQRNQTLRALVLGLAVTLLSFYGYVDASDAREWVTAGRHAQTFLAQTQSLLPTLPPTSKIFVIGLPGNIGTAYVIAVNSALQSAFRWFYRDQSIQVGMEKEELRTYLQSADVDLTQTYVLFYERSTFTTQVIDWVEECSDNVPCTRYPMATFQPAQNVVQQVTFQENLQLVDQRLSPLYSLRGWFPQLALTTCWQFTAPSTFDAAVASNADLTFFVHFTDTSGDTTIEQADHKLQQAYPFTPHFLPTSQWPLNQPLCDVTPIAEHLADSEETPLSIRGGVWLPDRGHYLTPEVVDEYTLDQYGRIVFAELPSKSRRK